MADWGLLPEQAMQLAKRRKWDHVASLKALLLGDENFPVRVPLKPPTGRKAVSDLEHFARFVEAWQKFPHPEMVQWEKRTFRALSEQAIPTFLIIHSIRQLIQLIGNEAARRSDKWERRMTPILDFDGKGAFRSLLYPVLVKRIESVEKLTINESELIASLLSQLTRGLGDGCCLRALPVTGVDTKFLETHQRLIAELLDAMQGGGVSAAGGLLKWLGCSPPPKGWLLTRPLCEKSRASMGGFPVLLLPGDVLMMHELPASRILVVENHQSGLALPPMEDAVAVAGGGKNVSWMAAEWLCRKRVGYWGDIDTWGFAILSDVRSNLPSIEPLMMDRETLLCHEERMAPEPKPLLAPPQFLTKDEIALFNDLLAGKFKSTRLEQERLSADYINQHISNWSRQ